MVIAETLLHVLQHDKHLSTKPHVLVAVSGGVDSLALLHALVQVRGKLPLQITAATFHHGLRDAATGDVQFVQAMCAEWNVPLIVGQAQVAVLAQQENLNLEAAARQARYQFLGTTARNNEIDTILTAHHADDQAETLLLHLIRGSGLQGLVGMLPVAPLPYFPQLRLLRPLLTVRRGELEMYCQTHRLLPRHDETNTDTTLRRNALRHEVLPRLAQMNPQIVPALGRLAAAVREELDYLQERYTQEVTPHIHYSAGRVRLPFTIFQKLHSTMQRRFLQQAVQHLQGMGGELDFERLQAAQKAAQVAQVGTIVEFAQGVRLRCEYSQVCVEKLTAPPELPPFYLPKGSRVVLHLNADQVLCNHWMLHLSETPLPNSLRLMIPRGAAFTLRTRQSGDGFRHPDGHQRKLKQWFVNLKIPQGWRDLLPLLLVNDEIVAVGLPQGWILAESVVTELTNPQLQQIIYLVSVQL